MREINDQGLDLIKSFEGLAAKAYQDIGGVWTIGYGHTGPDVTPGMKISEEQAEELLHIDLQTKAYPIDIPGVYVTDDAYIYFLNDNQYAALCSLCFNCGINRVRRSQTYALIKAGKAPDVEWLGFNLVNGKPVEGLARRRQAELVLYHTPVSTS